MGKLTPVSLAWVLVGVMVAACIAFLLGARAIGGGLLVVALVAVGIWWPVWIRSRSRR